jgi:hypothetical protein
LEQSSSLATWNKSGIAAGSYPLLAVAWLARTNSLSCVAVYRSSSISWPPPPHHLCPLVKIVKVSTAGIDPSFKMYTPLSWEHFKQVGAKLQSGHLEQKWDCSGIIYMCVSLLCLCIHLYCMYRFTRRTCGSWHVAAATTNPYNARWDVVLSLQARLGGCRVHAVSSPLCSFGH